MGRRRSPSALTIKRAQQPDVVILATSILSMEAVLDSFPVARLRRSTLVVDVLSVKARRCSVTLLQSRKDACSEDRCLHANATSIAAVSGVPQKPVAQ